ncbi:MAG: HAMP domain-containing sensor histidine kinase [Pseudomonadota bacterium]
MNSVFWKIFLSFIVMLAAVGAITVHVSFYLAGQRAASINELKRIDVQRDAEAALVDGGREGFARWLRRDAGLPLTKTIFLIDETGDEILDRKLPAETKMAFGRLKKSGRLKSSKRVPKVVDADGNVYLFLLGPGRPPAMGVFATPGVNRVVLVLALLVTATVCFLLTRYLVAPLTRVTRAAEALADGKLSARAGAEAYRHDELGRLAAQFDDMADALQRQMQTRQDLLRNASHELRSPLARIQVALELARRQPDAITEQLERIEREAEQMEALTAQMLNLARAQSDAASEETDVDLAELLQQIVDDACFEGAPRDRDVQLDTHGDALVLRGHPELLASAIENVVRNALRFTPEGSQVDVDLVRENGHALIAVRDSGPGIPETLIAHIFEPFFQGQSKAGTAGVGLAVSKQVVDLHGGTMRARNRSEGGLEVEIRLPLTGDQDTSTSAANA